MKIHWKYAVLLCILILAAVLRLYKLGSVPASPDWDEAALGYNAYSVLKTGKDEYGTRFPLTLRSFDDYKPPLYMYLAIPPVALMGLSVASVRLPSALAGILSVAGTYVLVSELIAVFGSQSVRKKKDHSRADDVLPLIAAFLMAVSPWHIQFSRIAFEANTGVALNIWGIALYLKGLRKGIWLSLSAVLLGLALYAYHSERLFVPIITLLLVLLTYKQLFSNRRAVLAAVIAGVITVLPLITVFANPTVLTRLKGTSSLSDQTGLLMRSVTKLQDDIASGNRLGPVFDNRRIVWVQTVIAGYLSHFSVKWLFLNADNPRHHAPDMGLMYLVELPFLLWGMVRIWKRGGSLSYLLFGWTLAAPVAASVTTELPHAIRTLVFLPSLQIFTAAGLIGLYETVTDAARKFKGGRIVRALVIAAVGGAALFNFVYYLDMYYAHMDREVSQYWQYGYREAVRYAETNKSRYRKIVVSTKLEQPHMFFLFFTGYDPVRYLAEGGTASGGFRELRNKFGPYEFRPIRWGEEQKDGTVLYIGSPSEITNPNRATIRYLDGSPAMMVADR